MSDIHYFPRYTTKENAVTNNSLLLLLRLYQYNRYKFEKFMEALGVEEEITLPSFGLQFNQQTSTGKSVLDGFLWQDSIKIAVETKLGNDFDVEQLTNHLAAFKDEQYKILILLNPTSESRLDSQLESIQNLARPRNIQVIHATFADIVEAARLCLSDYDEEMLALVDDFEAFCSERALLPRDQYTIFVPSCGDSVEENITYRLYYCPVTRSVRNARYLGIYARKIIRAIGTITKIVACDIDLVKETVQEHKDQPKLTGDEKQRILDASEAATKRGWDLSREHKFYLCDEMHETNFRKVSPGSMMGKRYIDLQDIVGGRKIPDNLKDLATLLREHEWK